MLLLGNSCIDAIKFRAAGKSTYPYSCVGGQEAGVGQSLAGGLGNRLQNPLPGPPTQTVGWWSRH